METWVRVLVTGATGFIGSAVVARLQQRGHRVVAAARRLGVETRALGAERVIRLDFSTPTDAGAWLDHLTGVDAVVNCVGVLQDSRVDSTRAAHVDGPAALLDACERAGVRKVIHLSAIGANVQQPTAFSSSKFAGEAALTGRDLDWVILRPSVVVGRPAYGGSALFRGLAALPILPVLPNTGQLQIVQLDDLARTIIFFLEAADAPGRIALDVAGPERLAFEEVVAAYRAWLGWRPARRVQTPAWLAAAAYKAGDFIGWLGWRPPIRSTARLEIAHGAVGDATRWREITGIEPLTLSQALAGEPASVQERWFSQLYLLKPLAFSVFSMFWIATGFVSLGPGWSIGKGLMLQGGVGDPMASITVVAGALADIAIGVAIALRRTARLALYAALAISVLYTIIGSVLVPELWREPLGPMLKIWPIMAFNLLLLAILRDR